MPTETRPFEPVPASAQNTVPQAHPAEFPDAPAPRHGQRLPLERFLDVQVEITVEIGRVLTTLGELLQMGTGAVIELDRSVSDPVDIVAQGTRIGKGEIIVVDDRFAVRITQIESSETGVPQQPSLQSES